MRRKNNFGKSVHDEWANAREEKKPNERKRLKICGSIKIVG